MFLGVCLFAASHDAYLNLEASYDHMFSEAQAADFTIVGGDTTRVAERVRALPGVAAVEERRVVDTPLRLPGGRMLIGRLLGMSSDEQPAVNRVLVTKGDYLSGDPTQVLVEQHLAGYFSLDVGDQLEALAPTG